jgi:hypothetical protein
MIQRRGRHLLQPQEWLLSARVAALALGGDDLHDGR